MTSPTGLTTTGTDCLSGIGVRSRRTAGFTLLELIAVMVTLAAVVAVSTPMLRNFFKSRQLVEESRRILALIEFGQREAVSSGVPIQILFDMDLRRLSVRREDGFVNIQRAFPGPFELADRVEIDFNRFPPLWANVHALTFLPDGTPAPNNPPLIILRDQDNTERSFTIARIPGQLEYLLLTPDDNRLQFIQQPQINQIPPAGIHLR